MSYRNGENLWKSIKKKQKVERLGHVTCVDQLEASIQVLRSRDLC